MLNFKFPFDIGAKVLADGDTSNVLVVTGFWVKTPTYFEIQVSWWCNGDRKEEWLPSWSVVPAPVPV